MNKAVYIAKEADDTTIVDCEIVGGLETHGKRTKLIGTKIIDFKGKHPGWFYTTITLVCAPILIGIILLAIEYKIFRI